VADVFVSYARSDRERVAPLVAALEAQGWSVWWDPNIAPGQEFDRQIVAELRAASAVLVVWTPTSVESRWVRGEARDAADRGVLVPVRFGAAELPIDVRAFNTIDLDGWQQEPASARLAELARALGARIAVRAGAARGGAAPGAAAAVASAPPAVSPTTESGPARLAICVLPFANMSGDPEQEYFSDGITEDIITDLSKVSALAVIARNSSFAYKGQHVDVPRVARELGVSHVLEGSVRKAGGRVRITAQLVRAAANDHVWAERYDRDLDDIFALQDEISEAIVRALKLRLLPAEKRAIEQRGTDSAEAYNVYLMAWRQYVNNHRTETDARLAEAILRLCARATELDPGYAKAWILTAVAQMMLHFVHGRQGEDGLAAAERALALNPDMAEAHAIKSRILGRRGDSAAAAQELEAALRLDPESFEVNRAAGYWHFRQKRLPEAIRHYEKAMAMVPDDTHVSSMLTSWYASLGDQAAARRIAAIALDQAEQALARDQNNWSALMSGANALCVLDQSERAKQWMQRALLAEPDKIELRYNFGCDLIAHLHDKEAAIDMLRPVFANMSRGFFGHALVDPDLDPLRDDPRFQEMMAQAEARLASAPPQDRA
jgi:adenylate cyclase